MMINAKEEFVNHVMGEGIPAIICAKVFIDYDWEGERKEFNLKLSHSERDLNAFLFSLDFKYDNGYGGQNLFGTIWYEDGTFSQRGEYDGAEWWEYVAVPEIPDELK